MRKLTEEEKKKLLDGLRNVQMVAADRRKAELARRSTKALMISMFIIVVLLILGGIFIEIGSYEYETRTRLGRLDLHSINPLDLRDDDSVYVMYRCDTVEVHTNLYKIGVFMIVLALSGLFVWVVIAVKILK